MQRKILRHFGSCWDKKGVTTAEKTDKLFCVNVVCVMMLTSIVSCVHLSLVNDIFVRMSANLNHWILIDGVTQPIHQTTRCVRDI